MVAVNTRAPPPSKHQAPKPKLQRSSKSQNTKPPKQMPGQTARSSFFELGAWSLEFGIWNLEFFPWALSFSKIEMRHAERARGSYGARNFFDSCAVTGRGPPARPGSPSLSCFSLCRGRVRRPDDKPRFQKAGHGPDRRRTPVDTEAPRSNWIAGFPAAHPWDS